MTIWFVEQAEGEATVLQATLQQLTAQGWSIFAVLTNGINRWTVVASKVA